MDEALHKDGGGLAPRVIAVSACKGDRTKKEETDGVSINTTMLILLTSAPEGA